MQPNIMICKSFHIGFCTLLYNMYNNNYYILLVVAFD